MQDSSDRDEVMEMLEPRKRARHEDAEGVDFLTGLLDHGGFRHEVESAISEGRNVNGSGDSLALVYFNIENFKHYNQRYGFVAGDELLRHVGRSIEEAFPRCAVGRLSADQFMVLTSESRVERGAREARNEFRQKNNDSSFWLKAGYYVLTPEDEDAGVACDRPKMACDEIRGRRDCYLNEFDQELSQRIVWRRYVLDHFDIALEEGWIHAFCQPIVRVATGEACDVEALARWIDPERGVVPPGEFISVLEDARLIHKLDLAVLRDVCRTCRELEDAGLPYIPPSVNLSRLDFELCDIVSEVEAVIDEYGIPRSMVSIEITESALVGDHEFLKDAIDRFRAEGFEVWMDDFGSGYSSLNVLKDYTFDLVKIDMAFLAGFEESEQTRVMLAKVIDMVKELGIHTLVEGVETAEQYEYLRSLGCGRVQGFLFGRPAPLPDSVEGLPNDTHPEPELLAKRSFYEDIGLVNLMRPDPRPSVTGHYLPSDVPACIIRRRDGIYEYLNVNDLYAKFLVDVGIGTPEDSEKVINDKGNPRRKNFVNVIDRCGESGDWERYPVLLPSNKILVIRMKMISQNAQFEAIAVVSIVEEVIDIEAEDHEMSSDLRFK